MVSMRERGKPCVLRMPAPGSEVLHGVVRRADRDDQRNGLKHVDFSFLRTRMPTGIVL
jgi:hypothetical protein